jgi:hypothetical protein
MSVETKTSPTFAVSKPRVLFQRKEYFTYMANRRSKGQLPDVGFEVTRDGTRFLTQVPDPEVPNPPITVVFNWLAGNPAR